MPTSNSTFTTESSGPDGRLPQPFHRLHYLDLAVGADDDVLHDFICIQFHATFDFNRPVKRRYKRGPQGRRMFAIKSPDIILKATVSHPPTYELADAMSKITTTLLSHSLPQIRDSWFPNNCWKTVDLPTRLRWNATTTDTTSNNISDVERIAFKLNNELTPAETHPGVYARDTTGSPSCSTSLDALGPGAMAESRQLPQGSAPGYPVVRNLGTECLNGCVGTPNTPTFEDVKVILALHDLPRGVVREIHSCVLQREGFEDTQWPYVLDDNLVLEPRKSALLYAIHNLVSLIY
ncbi:uncharacterized protein HD556DRAFT_1446687 [Suillus plorans]|uniref:Uncharacterized protein n=1 Tax=Suillus plorans TaxID=116603 RepID=A0A9P7DDL7_9AGAM|nr:uncharacterized protein HD556DRAFT_1446687 [Suillus plorans]KAG1789899.1 hypothetical protein HD556DRAFT_1446687 [Suillus plorans]